MSRNRKPPGDRKQSHRTPVQIRLDCILDDLNAFGFLAAARRRAPAAVLRFGPKDVHGAGWSGAVIWYRPAGYYHYRGLTLLGIWAWDDADTVQIALGTRKLAYAVPFYNPESYFHHLRRDFALYYRDEAAPPEEADRLYVVVYEPARRLEIRRQLEATLDHFISNPSGSLQSS